MAPSTTPTSPCTNSVAEGPRPGWGGGGGEASAGAVPGGDAAVREEEVVAAEREGHTRARDDGGEGERERVMGRHPAQRIPLPLYFGRTEGGAAPAGR